MKKVLFLLLIVFIVSGCEMSQDSAMNPEQEKEEVLVEESIEALEEVVSSLIEKEELSLALIEETEIVEEDVTTKEKLVFVLLDENKIEVVSEEIKVEALVLAKKEEIPIVESSEEIITQNRWGFSILDPETGIIEYYASKGGFLGQRPIQ